MAREGATVVLTDISTGASFPRLDITDEDAWREVIARIRALDVLVNNAGVGIGGDVSELSLSD